MIDIDHTNFNTQILTVPVVVQSMRKKDQKVLVYT